jgi:hypothetical protein
MGNNPNITDNLSEIKESKAEINNLDIQNRIIEDIKEMDMDNLIALIEHMYPVKAIDINGEDIELTVNGEMGFKTLNEIF